MSLVEGRCGRSATFPSPRSALPSSVPRRGHRCPRRGRRAAVRRRGAEDAAAAGTARAQRRADDRAAVRGIARERGDGTQRRGDRGRARLGHRRAGRAARRREGGGRAVGACCRGTGTAPSRPRRHPRPSPSRSPCIRFSRCRCSRSRSSRSRLCSRCRLLRSRSPSMQRPAPCPGLRCRTPRRASHPRPASSRIQGEKSVGVFLNLTDGQRVWVGRFGSEEAAERRAQEVIQAFVRPEPGVWPRFGGRFVRPEAVVSVEPLKAPRRLTRCAGRDPYRGSRLRRPAPFSQRTTLDQPQPPQRWFQVAEFVAASCRRNGAGQALITVPALAGDLVQQAPHCGELGGQRAGALLERLEERVDRAADRLADGGLLLGRLLLLPAPAPVRQRRRPRARAPEPAAVRLPRQRARPAGRAHAPSGGRPLAAPTDRATRSRIPPAASCRARTARAARGAASPRGCTE